jgi:KaiC/GvpD/RAD55 family RecA-like ATPase
MHTLKIKRAIESILSSFSIEEVTNWVKKALRAIYELFLFFDVFTYFIERFIRIFRV